MSLNFAPGETNTHVDQFSPSVLLFWLKAEMGVSSTRLVHKVPNTILGVIPLGAADQTTPLSNIASVGVNTSFSVGRLIGGLFLLLLGLGMIAQSAAGLLFLLFGLSLLANAMSAQFDIVNNGGGSSSLRVSILEKAKLEQFREEVNQRLFSDQARLRHDESMDVQRQQLQAQLFNNQMQQAAQQDGQQTPPPPPPGAPAPAQYQVGDVINGHRFNGTTWEPVDTP